MRRHGLLWAVCVAGNVPLTSWSWLTTTFALQLGADDGLKAGKTRCDLLEAGCSYRWHRTEFHAPMVHFLATQLHLAGGLDVNNDDVDEGCIQLFEAALVQMDGDVWSGSALGSPYILFALARSFHPFHLEDAFKPDDGWLYDSVQPWLNHAFDDMALQAAFFTPWIMAFNMGAKELAWMAEVVKPSSFDDPDDNPNDVRYNLHRKFGFTNE